ncbi:hypothetical protein L1987_56165 [Smallanthus sonchifolius]|uniref:Uncharacterized protein n=1 Tax=Smallanthus sonchifolius TaxID=185202 RepID=A0ACB9EBW4_9ASTR|nr:hypothetical protein L1987_56165 [Smallanthus sonchifolius]
MRSEVDIRHRFVGIRGDRWGRTRTVTLPNENHRSRIRRASERRKSLNTDPEPQELEKAPPYVKMVLFNTGQNGQEQSIMGGGRVAHPVLKGPSVVKELVIGAVLGLAAGGLWKMHHWNEQRKTRAFYDLLEKGEISVVVEEE